MSRTPHGVDPVLRTRARRRAMQALYAWQMAGGEARQIIAQFAHEQAREQADLIYFEDLVRGVIEHQATLDNALREHLDRDVDQVDGVERAVLRIAAYEMRYRIDVPYRVVINEAIETVKRFGAEHGHTYINGVLDQAALDWRSVETKAGKTP